MITVNTIIIGGGISGISFSQRLSQAGVENLVIEKEQIGGCISSNTYKDIWFEMGAHTIYNSYSDTIGFIKKNDLNKEVITRKKLPFLFVTPKNQIQSIFSNLNYLTLIPNYIKNRNISKEGKTVKQYASKVFGKSNYDKTFKYCFSAVLSQDSDNFPMKYLFKKYDRDTSLPRSFTLKKGLATLATRPDINSINEDVLRVLPTENNDWIVTTNKSTYVSKNICFATPWNVTRKLISDILPNTANHEYAPTMSHLTSIGVVIAKEKLNHIKNIAGLIGKQQFFYSALSRDVVGHDKYRAIVFHCKAGSRYNTDDLINKITELLKISGEDILHTTIKKNSLPCYNKNHDSFIKELEDSLSAYNNVFITGNFFDRLAVENCIRRSNHQADTLLNNKSR